MSIVYYTFYPFIQHLHNLVCYSKFLSSFDPFHGQKEASYVSYTSSISTLAKYILSVTSATDMSAESNRQHLEHAVLVSVVFKIH